MNDNTYCPVCGKSDNTFLPDYSAHFPVYLPRPEPCCYEHQEIYQERQAEIAKREKERAKMRVTVESVTVPKTFQPFKLILQVDSETELVDLEIMFSNVRTAFQEQVKLALKKERDKLK